MGYSGLARKATWYLGCILYSGALCSFSLWYYPVEMMKSTPENTLFSSVFMCIGDTKSR